MDFAKSMAGFCLLFAFIFGVAELPLAWGFLYVAGALGLCVALDAVM